MEQQVVVESPPHFGPGRSILYGSGNVGAGMVFAFTSHALPFYLASYGLPNVLIGLLGQDRPPTAGLLQVIVGPLSDRTRTRFGRRRPYLLVGIPVAALALLLLATRPPLPLMLVALLLMSSFLAIGYGPFLALLADLVPSGQRGRVGSVLAIGNMIGQLSLLFLASQLWPSRETLVFVIVAGVLVLGFSIAFVGVAEPPPTITPEPVHWRPRAYLRDLAHHAELAKYLLATLFFWFGSGSVVPFLSRFGVNELGTDEGTAFRLLMLAFGATAVCTLPAGWLGDRLGKKPVLAVGLLLFGVSVAISSQVRTVEEAAVALLATGAANGICTAMLFPLLTDLIPRARAGEFVGLGAAIWELAQPLGAMLGGLAADLTGSLRTSLLAAGVLVLVGWLLLLRVRPDVAVIEAERPILDR